ATLARSVLSQTAAHAQSPSPDTLSSSVAGGAVTLRPHPSRPAHIARRPSPQTLPAAHRGRFSFLRRVRRRTPTALTGSPMRALVVIGVVLVPFGICALVFGGVTSLTTEWALDAGPFHVDVQKPHTIVFNPIVGIVASAAGAVMIVAGI